MPTVVAFPSQMPGGLGAELDSHLEHCGLYTLLAIKDKTISFVSTLSPAPHEHGACLAVVQHLLDNNVQVLVAGSMGIRPLTGFQQAGIRIFNCGGCRTVREAAEAFMDGRLQGFDATQTCGAC